MGEHWDLDRLTDEWVTRGFSRRALLRLLASGAGAAAVAAVLDGAASGMREASAAATGGQVSVLWKQPVILNPLFSTSGNEQQVERLMFGALVRMNDKLVPTPELAEKIDVSADAKTYTFHLYKNITFTDGQPLTAKDVVFTFERAIDKRTGSIWLGRFSNIVGALEYSEQKATSISGIQTPDDYTVVVNMVKPDAAFLVILCNYAGFGILPMHVLESVPPDQLKQNAFSLNPSVTAGAFKFTSFQPNQYLQMDRNDHYFGEKAPLDRIIMRILTPEVGLAELQTGELDLAPVSASEVARLQTVPHVKVASVPSPSLDFLNLNLTRPYLQDVNLRKAMITAIDRPGIVKQIFRGQAEVVNSPIFGPAWMGVPDGLDPYPYDPDKAKMYLSQSKWDKSRTLQLMNLPGDPERDAAISIMQEELTQVGIKAKIYEVDSATLNAKFVEAPDFDILYEQGGVFRADPSVSGTYFLTQDFSPKGDNAGHYSNPQVDQLFAQGVATTDLAQRKAIYTKAAQLLNADLPWIYLWSPSSIYGFRDRLQGFAPPSYIDNKLWNAETWSVSS